MKEAEFHAYEVVGKHPRLPDLIAVTRSVVAAALRAPAASWIDSAAVKAQAETLHLAHEDAATPYGNALAVLERGPEDDAERALARSLWGHALATADVKYREGEERVGELLWLALHTPFDATRLIDRALGPGAAPWWDAIAERIRRYRTASSGVPNRAEALLGAAALSLSSATNARAHTVALRQDEKDPAIALLLAAGDEDGQPSVRGEWRRAPRGVFATIVLGMTGILFVIHVVRLLGKHALGYKHNAELTMTSDGVRIRARAELLSWVLRDRELVLGRQGLVGAAREILYPGMALYVGLIALALGSYFGVSMLVDGVRAASPTLLLAGVVMVAIGLGLDFVFGSLMPGVKGRCRMIFTPRRGARVCIADVDVRHANAFLNRLAN